jgi:hypothetical protein
VAGVKRGEPMRRTPLARGTSSMARTAMKRTSSSRPARAAVPALTDAEQACLDRDGQTCQRCLISLWGIMASKHHRKRRREYDADRVENIVLLCGSGNTGCHGFVTEHPRTARDEGWVVWSTGKPEEVPCLTAPGCTGRKPDSPAGYRSMKMFLPDGTMVEDALIVLPGTGPIWEASE